MSWPENKMPQFGNSEQNVVKRRLSVKESYENRFAIDADGNKTAFRMVSSQLECKNMDGLSSCWYAVRPDQMMLMTPDQLRLIADTIEQRGNVDASN